MARYGRDFGTWNQGYDPDYRRYSGQGNRGGGYYGGGYSGEGSRGYYGGERGGFGSDRGYYGGERGGFGANRSYDFDRGFTPWRGNTESGGMYGRGETYRGRGSEGQGDWAGGYDRDLGDRIREGWNDFRQGVRRTFRGGYDRGW